MFLFLFFLAGEFLSCRQRDCVSHILTLSPFARALFCHCTLSLFIITTIKLSSSLSSSLPLFIMRDHSAECATKPRMCLICSSPLAPACDKPCEPCNNKGDIDRCAARQEQQTPNELPRSRITWLFWQQFGIRWCDGLSSSGADTDRTDTDCHSVLQDLRCVIALQRGTSPDFAQDTENNFAFALGLSPNERAKWLRRIQVTIDGGHDRTPRAFA